MIELELKYCLTEIPQNPNNLVFTGRELQNDVYFDTKEYDLLRNGNFLRVRNDKTLEFKIDIDDDSHLVCKETSFALDTFPSSLLEINNVLNILGISDTPVVANFQQFLEANRLQIIAPINKKRSNFCFGDHCTISFDEVDDLGCFLEAEIMIESDSISLEEADSVKRHLVSQLRTSEILTANAKAINVGYVELYLQKYNKQAYDLGKFKK